MHSECARRLATSCWLALAIAIVAGCNLARGERVEVSETHESIREPVQPKLSAVVDGSDILVTCSQGSNEYLVTKESRRTEYATGHYSGLCLLADLLCIDPLVSTVECCDFMSTDERYVWGGPLGWLLTFLPGICCSGDSLRTEYGPETTREVEREKVDGHRTREPLSVLVVVEGVGERAALTTDEQGACRIPLFRFASRALESAPEFIELQVTAGTARSSVTVPFETLVRAADRRR